MRKAKLNNKITVLSIILALLISVVFFAEFRNGNPFADVPPGLNNATDTGSPTPIYSGRESGMIDMGSRRGSDTRRIYKTGSDAGSGYLVDFSGLTPVAQTGNITNPVGNDYNLKKRGPEDNSQMTGYTAPVAYSTRAYISGNQTFGGRAGVRDSLTALQVWINVGGEMQSAIQSGVVENLSFDFYFGVGAHSWVGSTISDENAGTETYLDLSYAQDAAALTTVDNYKYPRDRRFTETRKGNIHASSRDKNNTINKRETWGLSDCAVQDGGQWKRFQEYTVTFDNNNPHLKGIADNGGFWLKLSAQAMAWTSASGWATAGAEAETAAVLEGVRCRADYTAVTYRSSGESMGTVDNTQKVLYSSSVLSHSATAAPVLNHYFTGWTGEAVPEGSSRLSVTSKNRGVLSYGDYTVTANFAPVPMAAAEQYTFTGSPQGPQIDTPDGHTAEDANYTGVQGITGTPYNSANKPINAGNYTYSAKLIRNGEIVGQVIYYFEISRADGFAVINMPDRTWGDEPGILTVLDASDEYAEPQVWYQVNQAGDWVKICPDMPGTHNVRAEFTGTDNYNPLTTAPVSFIIDKISVDVPVQAALLTYNCSQQSIEIPDREHYKITGGTSSETAAGSYSLTITLNEPDYYRWSDEGEVSRDIQWNIAPKKLGGGALFVAESKFVYNGLEQLPELRLSDGDTALVENIDYFISPFDPVGAGIKTIEVIFTGNYTGEAVGSYEIAKKSVELPVAANRTYNGAAQTPGDWVKGTDGFIVSGNTSCTNAGKYITVVTLTDADNYEWADGIKESARTLRWEIAGKTFLEENIIFSANSFNYNGLAQKPSVTVRDSVMTLALNADYTLKFDSDLINAGKKAVTVIFHGNFTGTLVKYYYIEKAEPVVIPAYTIPVKLYTTSLLPPLSLADSSIPGEIIWQEYQIKEGTHNYSWIFIPAAGYIDNYNTVTGTLKFTAEVPVIKEILIEQSPDKTLYTAFESFDVKGLIIRIISEDNESGFLNLSDGVQDFLLFYDNGGNSFRAGERYITLQYKNKSVDISVSVNKAQGADAGPVTVDKITATQIVLNASVADNGQEFEYAISENNSAPVYGWQSELIFDGLNSGTTYYLFARAKGSSDYLTGTASEAVEVKTLRLDKSKGCGSIINFSRPKPGNILWMTVLVSAAGLAVPALNRKKAKKE